MGLNDLLDALHTKYELLRKKLFWKMLRDSCDPNSWQQLNEADRIQKFQLLQLQEKQMREEGLLDTQVRTVVTSRNGSFVATVYFLTPGE